MTGVIFVSLFLVAITGCNDAGLSNLVKAETGYITHISENSVLVNDIVFSADNEVEVVSDNGKKMNFADLEIGMKVEPWFSGPIRESFPAQADMKKLVVLTDKEHDQVQEAVKAVVEYAATNFSSNTVVFQETIVKDTYFQAKIAGVTIEHPNPVTIRYDFATKQIEEQVD